MKWAGRERGVKLLAMRVIAKAVKDGDLRFTFEKDFPMWVALAEDDEKRIRQKVFYGLLEKKAEKLRRKLNDQKPN